MFSVLIRPLQEGDSIKSVKWRNDQDIWVFTGKRPNTNITEDIELSWIKKVLKESDSHRFAILADEIYIGNIQLTGIKAGEEGEYHIFIGEKSYWGKGIAFLASMQIIRFALEQLKLKRIFLYVNPNNNAALRLYEKLGFEKVSDEIKMVCDLTKGMKPVVSVFMMTYNHEPFIKQAIISTLSQKTSFDFNIIIGEDFSSDNTRIIVKEFAKRFPGKIKLLLHDRNVGPHVNQSTIFGACDGKYISMCEGDDYWTDPYKLQKQVDFLESNPDYGLVHTNFDMYYQNSGLFKRNYHSSRNSVCDGDIFENLLFDNTIATLTAMFRSNFLNSIDLSQMSSFKMGDKYLWLEIARRSKIGYINESTSVYRVLSKSASNHSGGPLRYDFISSSYKMNYYFIDKYGCSINTQEKVYRKALMTWFSLKERDHFNESYNRLKKINRLKTSDILKYSVLNIFFISCLHQLYRKSKLLLMK